MRTPEDAGWAWFEQGASAHGAEDLARNVHACLTTAPGELVLSHLRRVFLDRRLPPSASDAELRHLEGQRSVVAYLLGLIERARDPEREAALSHAAREH